MSDTHKPASSSSAELNENVNNELTVSASSPEPQQQQERAIEIPVAKSDASASTEAPISIYQVAFIIVGSIASSVLIVLVNKHMMMNFGFNMILTLTAVHFFLPWLFITIGMQLGFKPFESLRAPNFTLREKLIFCAAQCGSVGLNNVSLQVNSVGTYQLAKLLGIPGLVIVQASVFLEFVTTKVKVILLVIIVGVGIATVTDVSASLVGTFFALSAMLSTVFAQILGSRLQQNNKLTTGQLFYNTLLPQTLMVLAFAIPTEIANSPPILEKLWSFELPFFLILSCICASGVNFFAFAIIGKMSPITLQVVGHMKTCLILLFGFFLFDSRMPSSQVAKNLAGAFIAMVGVVAYGEVKRVEKYDKKQPQDAVDTVLISCRSRPDRDQLAI